MPQNRESENQVSVKGIAMESTYHSWRISQRLWSWRYELLQKEREEMRTLKVSARRGYTLSSVSMLVPTQTLRRHRDIFWSTFGLEMMTENSVGVKKGFKIGRLTESGYTK